MAMFEVDFQLGVSLRGSHGQASVLHGEVHPITSSHQLHSEVRVAKPANYTGRSTVESKITVAGRSRAPRVVRKVGDVGNVGGLEVVEVGEIGENGKVEVSPSTLQAQFAPPRVSLQCTHPSSKVRTTRGGPPKVVLGSLGAQSAASGLTRIDSQSLPDWEGGDDVWC